MALTLAEYAKTINNPMRKGLLEDLLYTGEWLPRWIDHQPQGWCWECIKAWFTRRKHRVLDPTWKSPKLTVMRWCTLPSISWKEEDLIE